MGAQGGGARERPARLSTRPPSAAGSTQSAQRRAGKETRPRLPRGLPGSRPRQERHSRNARGSPPGGRRPAGGRALSGPGLGSTGGGAHQPPAAELTDASLPPNGPEPLLGCVLAGAAAVGSRAASQSVLGPYGWEEESVTSCPPQPGPPQHFLRLSPSPCPYAGSRGPLGGPPTPTWGAPRCVRNKDSKSTPPPSAKPTLTPTCGAPRHPAAT